MKQKRKLYSFTLSEESSKKLELISEQEGVNKSRVVEDLINNYKLEKEVIYVQSVGSPFGPIAIPLDEIALRVSKIIKNA